MRSSTIVHGTIDGYSNHGCRCEPCRQAGHEYAFDRRTPCPGGCGRMVYGRYRPDRLCIKCRAKLRERPLAHGTETGYSKGCRCDACRQAATAARRKRR